jgi:Flp pilus assembly protein TadD
VIYSKTAQGQAAFQSRSVPMMPRQRAAFILFDGKRDVAEVLKSTAGMSVTADDISHLVSLGLLSPPTAAAQPVASPEQPSTNASARPQPTAALSVTADGQPTLSAQAHYSRAYPIATRLTAALGLRGFRLNLAVEAATDLDKLKELAPKIREAVGAEKFLELENALYY